MRTYHVYIMASESGTLYVGVTGNLEGRVMQHKLREIKGFTKQYSCKKLVYFEEHNDIEHAILREKQIKRWRREKKEFLIKLINPSWIDLSSKWNSHESDSSTRPNRPRSE